MVIRDDHVLVFTEVKTRIAPLKGRPLDAVDRDKEIRLESGARAWLAMLPHPEKVVWRIDVVEVILEEGKVPEIHLIKRI